MGLAAALIGASSALQSQAVVVDFTGGTVTRLDATTETTNNLVNWDNVDYYEQGGFRLDFLPNAGSAGFATHVGNYYGLPLNDVIHSHWDTGDFGGVMTIEITKVGGGTFDLNYFRLTSNTDDGGYLASGNEQAYVEGFDSFNVSTGPAVLLPSEDWGFPTTQIYLGSAFDAVETVRVFVSNRVDCFGMDEFYLDQAAPDPDVPEPSSIASLAGGMGLVVVSLRRRKRASPLD
jgi:hypothetical protein